MALINATSFAGILLLLYLSSFVLFAILRIATGVSIQRIGYLSLRHIAFTPREGLRIDVRGVGLAIHRPSFAQPTWISLKLTELKLTIDPALLGSSSTKPNAHGERRSTMPTALSNEPDGSATKNEGSFGKQGRSKLWKKLTNVKEKIKRIHSKIHLLRMLDIVAVNTTVDVVGVGSMQLSAFTMAVHTRRKLLDRGRLFRHKKDPQGDQRPAEWVFTIKSVLLNVSGIEPVEVLDVASLNVHGILYKERQGLRDTSIALKVGRLHVPLDEILVFKNRMNDISRAAKDMAPISPVEEMSFSDVAEELDRPGSREASIVQTVADSKEFFSSILQSVQEIQLAMSFVRFSREIEALRQANLPLTLNVVTHEIGFDLHQLDQSAPAHRMYFSRDDIAHQALLAAISISVSLDEDDSNSNKIVYIPMATTTIKTTLPSKTMNFTEERSVTERNANILFANLVITSPSVDLIPRHLIQLLTLAQKVEKSHSNIERNNHRLISRLLPKASIKFSIHEPVIRFVLPVANSTSGPDDYDMIISSISSISLDIESSHSGSGDLLYSLASNLRVVSHQLYYQASSGIKHNLMVNESLELKVQLSASTEVCIIVSGDLRSFSILMVREEVSKGVYDIVRHFRRNTVLEKVDNTPSPAHLSFLRRLPHWLLEFHFEGSDCSVEMAGVDTNISKQTRGFALQLESWTADYSSQSHVSQRRPSSRRKASTSVRNGEGSSAVKHPAPSDSPSKKHPQAPSDGRRIAIHVKGFEGFIIESLDKWESQPFLAIPRFEVAFSTSRDLQGPIFHINSAMRAFYLEFSLYRFYSIGVAGMVMKDAFWGPPSPNVSSSDPDRADGLSAPSQKSVAEQTHSVSAPELVTIDLKVGYVQIKGHMPADPSLLLQVYEVAAGRHRWSAPFIRSQLLRFHAEAPGLSHIWARLVSMNAIRLDIRRSKRRTASGFVEERSIDVSTDFIRIAIPHSLTMYKIFDNIINTVKATAQLDHRFRTRTNEYILRKAPEGSKNIPRISLRSKALMFELEDDPFEFKLGVIYHIGQAEQKQRLARAEAYRVKIKRMNDDRHPRSSSRFRTQSNRPASPHTTPEHPGRRSNSQERHNQRRSRSQSRGRRGMDHGRLRYNREGMCALTSSSKIQAHEAWDKLQRYNARSWKKRIDATIALQKNAIKDIRRMFSGADEPPQDSDANETILSIPNRPGLMTTIISDLHLIVDKPSFPLSELPHFLHDIGKGMPYGMEYSLLVPMHLSLDMGEARVMLRDFPLNLLHIPAIRAGQPPRLPSWSLRTDFVIAEEYRDDQSSRHLQVNVVPKGQHATTGEDIPAFAVDVRRTVSPVKTYSRPVIEINTSLPTSISWSTSYQPVIQDMMMIIESFTKPEIDPSDRVGFWDKFRLSFHSRLTINFKGDGDLQLRLKGSRDPYVVTGYGAGFVMCWRGDVQWNVHLTDDPKKFMTVKSAEYVLAIPDYSREARMSPDLNNQHDGDSMSTNSSQKNAAVFKKVIMKLSGNVQWTAGLVFERDLEDGGRSFNFEPHYDVVLKNPKHMERSQLQGYDAFRGFRSHHIHLSVSVAAPVDRDWTANSVKASESYNSIHLSPRFFSHFWDWWHLFSGVMSLPVRQGPLWRGPEKKSKKFGRHLATIKYGLLLSPLFIAHVYKHKDAEDYKEDVVSATGLKLRINSFVLDLHQRREYFDTLSKGKSEQTRTSALKMNRAEVDFVSADLRAVAASIAGTTADDLMHATDEILASYQDPSANIDMSQFTIPDHDFSWIDMDDFVELDWVLPAEQNPETRILPLAFTPRFTYFRQTDHGNSISGDETRTSSFGDEPSHFCVMSQHNNDPKKVQMDLVRDRLEDIKQQISEHARLMGEQELRVVRDGDQDETLRGAHDSLREQGIELQTKRRFLEHGLRRLTEHPESTELAHHIHSGHDSGHVEKHGAAAASHDELLGSLAVDMDGLTSSLHEDFAIDFNNRFIIHNIQLKWNNALRNTILRYSHQVSQRRGFVYYMSRRAVKFILDIVDEQSKSKEPHHTSQSSQKVPPMPTVLSPTEEKDEEVVVQDRIEQLLKDAKRFVNADEKEDQSQHRPSTADIGEKIAEHFQTMNSYHIRLIAPQIQLQSEKNTKSVVLVSAKGMHFKVVAIMDKARMSDDVSGLVQRRFALDMDGAQFFVTTQKRLAKSLHMYAGNKYGNAPGSSWPPWVSLEVMFDFQLNPFGFQRVIQKTSASLRYEKYNPLRLKYNEEIESKEDGSEVRHPQRKESRIDHLWVDFPRIRASCDSAQYYTMYIIVLDLLLYSEPLEKTRNERLEKIMLASDFSDLRGAPEMATSLQERIRQLEDIKTHFQINAKYLDKDGWQDRINLEKDLAGCEDELFFIMKAITGSQQKTSEDRKATQSSGLLRWYLSASEIVWHLMRDKNEPLLEFQLGNAAYERIDNSDGSNHNAMEIQHIHGLNLLPNALYPEIIGPYDDPQKNVPEEQQKMLQVQWIMLEAIAGIPVLEAFHVSVFPLKVQLERDLGKKLFEYIFPGVGSTAFDGGKNFSPMMVKHMEPMEDNEDAEAEEAENKLSPEISHHPTNHMDLNSGAPGCLARRLRPTFKIDHSGRHGSLVSSQKPKGLGIATDHRHHPFRHTSQSNDSKADGIQTIVRKTSGSSLQSSMNRKLGSTTSLVALKNTEEKKKPFQRSSKSKKDKKEKPSDDLSQMLSRASNYMTLAHVRLNSFVVCLSYKGKSDRNLEDLHGFVFRMPTLEYRNKTWSNLDLALRLKKDVIKALISHTGAMIGNKFSHHKPNKQAQSRLRELVSSHALLPNSELINTPSTSETGSIYSATTANGGNEDSPRMSFQSNRGDGSSTGPSPLLRNDSFSSSINSDQNGSTFQVNLTNPGAGPPTRTATNDPFATARLPTAASNPHRSLLKDTLTLGRHLSSETANAVRKRSSQGGTGHEEDGSDAEGHKKKSVLLLGKKILGSLS